LETKTLLIFGPTICTRWNSQNSNLKKELMDYLEGLFGVDTFNKKTTTSLAGQYLKSTRDVYRVHLQKNPRYEHPPAVTEREWKVLIEDAKEKN
jgi:hypothetical protein